MILFSTENPGPEAWAVGCFQLLIVVGILQLLINLWVAVRDVNQHGAPPDTSEWIVNRER